MEVIKNQKISYKHRKGFLKIKRVLLGMKSSEGIFYKLMMYFLLTVLGFVFLYPILYMSSTSMMSNMDLIDNSIKWIPSKLNFKNYQFAYRALDFVKTLFVSIGYSGINTLALLISSSTIAYGLSRFKFVGRKLVIVLILLTFIMPKALFFIPTYRIMGQLHLTGNIFAILLPAISGQGLQAALFILIFFQFFNMIPKSLEEAAIVDGASSFKIFYKIAIPMAIPAIIITSVYAFSLYWNETFLARTYLEGKINTLPMSLKNLSSSYYKVNPTDQYNNVEVKFTEAKAFAGTILSILPLIAMYAIVQKWFVESIDKTGITGE
ncbi:MAG: transporter permease [Haloplasmataceae bacterium]|jgi:multiple sugar transport system permease protein|nr:transporter permease [Haloplasmataceae bacterium]